MDCSIPEAMPFGMNANAGFQDGGDKSSKCQECGEGKGVRGSSAHARASRQYL